MALLVTLLPLPGTVESSWLFFLSLRGLFSVNLEYEIMVNDVFRGLEAKKKEFAYRKSVCG